MKGVDSTYRPEAGTTCFISGAHCDDQDGYVFTQTTVLWRNDVYVLYGNDGCYPTLAKWDHIIAKI